MDRPVVLCVDDERAVLESLREQLRRHVGDTHAIEVAQGGVDALDILDQLDQEGAEVQLVLCDQVMPGVKGHTLLACIREIHPRAIQILLADDVSVEALGRAINEARLFRLVTKPWDEADRPDRARGAGRVRGGPQAASAPRHDRADRRPGGRSGHYAGGA